MGATDVCPLVPIANITMEECAQLARELAKEWVMNSESLYIVTRMLHSVRKGATLQIVVPANMRALQINLRIPIGNPILVLQYSMTG